MRVMIHRSLHKISVSSITSVVKSRKYSFRISKQTLSYSRRRISSKIITNRRWRQNRGRKRSLTFSIKITKTFYPNLRTLTPTQMGKTIIWTRSRQTPILWPSLSIRNGGSSKTNNNSCSYSENSAVKNLLQVSSSLKPIRFKDRRQISLSRFQEGHPTRKITKIIVLATIISSISNWASM